jgi:hypothetical protein
MSVHQKNIRRRVSRIVACGAWVVLIGGCQFSPQAPFWPNSLNKKTEPQLPDRITPFWTDTVLHQPKQPGIRGFGGRIYCYRDGVQDSIEVDGGLVVYAFDNEAPVNDASKPIKKFVFTADQFATHMSRTEMGPSYSIWLPWDEVGGETRQLSLVTRFEGRDGGVVISDPTVKLLPGVNKEMGNGEVKQGAVQRASFVSGERTRGEYLSTSSATGASLQTMQSSSDPRDSGRAMTIDLPPSFQRHLSSEGQRSRLDNRQLQEASGLSNQGSTPQLEQGLTTSGESEPSTEGPDSNSTSLDSRSPSASRLLPPGLRNTFRRNVKDSAEGSSAAEKPNSRPANWLVAPR